MECVALFERLYTDEAKAAARVKRAKARLAALAGKEVIDYHKDRTQAEKDKAAREDKNAARQETDWLIRVPTTLPGSPMPRTTARARCQVSWARAESPDTCAWNAPRLCSRHAC